MSHDDVGEYVEKSQNGESLPWERKRRENTGGELREEPGKICTSSPGSFAGLSRIK